MAVSKMAESPGTPPEYLPPQQGIPEYDAPGGAG